ARGGAARHGAWQLGGDRRVMRRGQQRRTRSAPVPRQRAHRAAWRGACCPAVSSIILLVCTARQGTLQHAAHGAPCPFLAQSSIARSSFVSSRPGTASHADSLLMRLLSLHLTNGTLA